jgi:chromosome segregation ATPase
VEIAGKALANAREAAEPVEDADMVRSRLNEFESELTTLNERVDALGAQLSSLVERAQAPDDLYATGRAIQEIRSEALDVQRGADSLTGEIEAFEHKLHDPDRWAEELGEDIDAIETSVEELLEVAINLSDDRDDGTEGADLALTWVDATLQNRMQKLFIEDVRAELDALRQIALYEETDGSVDRISRRLDDLESLRTDVGRRLDEASEPSWRRNHGGTIESFAGTLEDFEPPVNWTKLRERLESYREEFADAKVSGCV